jgi:predicted PurR-regulated permease PerM
MSEDNRLSPSPHKSPLWGRTAKVIVALLTLLLLAILARRFQSLIAQLVLAAMLAYILSPVILFFDRRTKVGRGTVIIFTYLLLAVVVSWVLISLGVAAFQQVSNFIDQVPGLISDVLTMFEELTSRTEPIIIGAYQVDPRDIPWDGITNQILGLAEPALGQGGQFVRQMAATTIRWAGNLLFIFVLSIYIANEIPKLGGYIAELAQPPGFRQDAERLMDDFGRVWSAYLRGQVILGLIVGMFVWLGLAILGVQNALALGLLSGILEFIPILGPVIGAGFAMVVAFFQPDNFLAISGLQFALLVFALMFVIQQLENNVLVPNIVGEALDMHPLLVMVAVFMGGSLAGILGAILAAPVAATMKLIGVYAWRKMFDLPPFPDDEPEAPPSLSLIRRGFRFIMRRSN